MDEISTVIADGTFTAEQIATMQQWAVEDGHLPADADIAPADADIAPAAESVADPVAFDVEAHPDAFGDQVRAGDYRFETPRDGEPMPLPEQIKAANALAAAGVPAAIGREFGRRWNAAMQAGPQPDATLDLGYAQGLADLQRRHGAEGATELLRQASVEVKALSGRLPWIKPALERTALGNDVWVAETLANMHRARSAKQ